LLEICLNRFSAPLLPNTQYLQGFGNFDGAIFQSYDELVAELDQIATQIQTSASDKQERSRYAQYVIESFEGDLRATQSAVRDV
jgi:hypothetical protein